MVTISMPCTLLSQDCQVMTSLAEPTHPDCAISSAESYAGAVACPSPRAWQWLHLFSCVSVSDRPRHAIPVSCAHPKPTPQEAV